MAIKLYPLKFNLRLHDKIWGGERIFQYKNIAKTSDELGESWEISPMNGNVSVVSNGEYAGTNLNDLVAQDPVSFLGKHVVERFGSEFPLLIKMIDANENLSVQVHPGDEFALKHHDSKGKTEMWYVLDATEDAVIYVGWKRDVNPDELHKIIDSGELIDYIHEYHVAPGDTFFIPAGTVHAIGKGCLVMEIQEASDITYRLYDYKRKDSQGRERELHVEESAKVLNYAATGSENVRYDRESKEPGKELVSCPYFKTSLLQFSSQEVLSLAERDSFTVLFCVEGDCRVVTGVETVQLSKGESLLLPAKLSDCTIEPLETHTKLIESYVPRQA